MTSPQRESQSLSSKTRLLLIIMVLAGLLFLSVSITLSASDQSPSSTERLIKLILEHMGVICIVVFSAHFWQIKVLSDEYNNISKQAVEELYEKLYPKEFA